VEKSTSTVLRGGDDGNVIPLTRPFRRGRQFGTILVDLDAHQVIDLLAERSSQTSADWMRAHPEIAYVSRDRGKDYAQGASDQAPQATHISDRFHLMKNFVEAIDKEVSRCYKHLRQVQLPLPSPDLPAPDEWRQAPDAVAERKRLARLADKQERYTQVKDLLARGLSPKEIAQQLVMPVRTVYRGPERESCPAHQPQRTKRTDKQEQYAQIKALRRLGLSQKEIAQRLAIGVRTLQRWQGRETSQTNPPRRKRRSIAGSLRCLRSLARASGRTFCLASVARNSETGQSSALSRRCIAL
jgi:DNA-binding NarL/FixJ family response regulator